MLTHRESLIVLLLLTTAFACSGSGPGPAGGSQTGGRSGTGGGTGGYRGTGGVVGSGGGACLPTGADAGTTADARQDVPQETADAPPAPDGSSSGDAALKCPTMIASGDICATDGMWCTIDVCHSCTGGSGYIHGPRTCACGGGKWGCSMQYNDCFGFDSCDNGYATDPTFYFQDSACTVPFCANQDAACR